MRLLLLFRGGSFYFAIIIEMATHIGKILLWIDLPQLPFAQSIS
jgi:hypothetical protein